MLRLKCLSYRNTWIIVQIAVFVTCTLIMFVDTAQSHPGRTDANDGHTCRTKCENWDLEYGEYHSHGTASISYSAEGRINGGKQAQDSRNAIEFQSRREGTRDGETAGSKSNAPVNFANPDPPKHVCVREFSFDPGTPEEYKLGFYQAWNNTCTSIANSIYRSSYREAYNRALVVDQQNEDDNKLEEELSNNSSTMIASGLVSIAMVSSIAWLLWYQLRHRE